MAQNTSQNSDNPIGASTNDITADLKNFVHCSIGSDEFKVLPLAGDASTRKYFRIVDDSKSWALMVWKPFESESDYPFLNIQNHFSRSGVEVPEVIAVDKNLGMILLEDLGDLTLERKYWETQDHAISVPFYIQAIEELLKIHFTATNDKKHSCVAFNVEFNTEKFLWEMNYAKTHLIEGIAEVKLSTAAEKGLAKDFESICKILDRQPKRISHRDYHSRNLMIKLDKMKVIDFQDARMGPVQYDLVSLLHDSYVDMQPNMQNQLLKHYLHRAKEEFNQTFDEDEFNQIMMVQLIQRCFKACGSFSSFLNQRSDRRYLHYIHPTLVKVVNTLDSIEEFRTLRSILVDEGLMEIDYEAL
ncbi:MAG: hypothetical protein CL677_09605 [Bdellovibrionaceae bacterium]|nr:hypothetical protein [Pseudobdellovibrionaceae bacterium]|tara:strand:- start:7094 stop:8167 length:1074 start_codon:yes stop_codon:yes gene_type:complete